MSTPTNIANFDGQKPVIDDDAVKGAEESASAGAGGTRPRQSRHDDGAVGSPDFP